MFSDCDEYFRRGYDVSGQYVIHPHNWNISIMVNCDMDADLGGWTVIQSRRYGDLDFTRKWEEYKVGFGNSERDHWLGNEIIYTLTNTKNYSLKLDMVDVENKTWYATYDYFRIESESDKYKLHVSGFRGNCTDSLTYSDTMGFSTFDQDNDASSTHCAMYYTAGWWYKHCHYSNLNGRFRLGMVWYNNDREEWIQLQSTIMKIIPNSIT